MKATPMISAHKTSPFIRKWWIIVLIAVVLFAVVVWLTGQQSNPTTIPQKGILEETNVQGSTLPIKEFPQFISQAKASTLPKTFTSETLSFKEGSTAMSKAADKEIEQISIALENFPRATIRIEGFSSDTGDLTKMKDLAFRRALIVKDKLVSKGINPDRIDTVGNASGSNKVAIIVTSIE